MRGSDGKPRINCWEPGPGHQRAGYGSYKPENVKCVGGPDTSFYNSNTGKHERSPCRWLGECQANKRALATNGGVQVIPPQTLVRPVAPLTGFNQPLQQPKPPAAPQPQQNASRSFVPVQAYKPQNLTPPVTPTSVPFKPYTAPATGHSAGQVQGTVVKPTYPVYPGAVPQQAPVQTQVAQPVPPASDPRNPANFEEWRKYYAAAEEFNRMHQLQAVTAGALQVSANQHQQVAQVHDQMYMHHQQQQLLAGRGNISNQYGDGVSATAINFPSLLAQVEPWQPGTFLQRAAMESARSGAIGIFSALSRFLSFNPLSSGWKPQGY